MRLIIKIKEKKRGKKYRREKCQRQQRKDKRREKDSVLSDERNRDRYSNFFEKVVSDEFYDTSAMEANDH